MGEGQGQKAGGRSLSVTETTDSDASGVRRTSGDERPVAQAAGPFVVYCGGCNPHIDRGAVARALVAAPVRYRPGAAVYLSGCPRACASGHRLTFARDDGASPGDHGSRGGHDPRTPDHTTVVVAGALVDGAPTATPDIAPAIIDKLKE